MFELSSFEQEKQPCKISIETKQLQRAIIQNVFRKNKNIGKIVKRYFPSGMHGKLVCETEYFDV